MIDPRRNAESAANNRIAVVNSLYDKFPMGEAVKGGAENIAEEVNSTVSIVRDTLNALRDANVIKVDLTWEAKGRRSMLTLVKPREEAIKTITGHNTDIENITSLKERIVKVLQSNPTIHSTRDLNDLLKESFGGASDNHNLTHVLYSLQREGRVTFSRNTSKDKVPFNIRLVESKPTESPVAAYEAPTSHENIEVESESTLDIIDAPEASAETFPLISAIVNREFALRQAAKFAEVAGAEDIAISLLERADAPLTPLEKEIVALYNKCMGE